MSIIIQTGHKTSQSKLLIEKLYDNGLCKPLPSYTHKLDYLKVVDTLDKMIAKSQGSILDSKLADTIMVDFLLANMDNEEWGWESEKNLDALKYWRQLDDEVNSILIFDHPKYIFSDIDLEKLDADILDDIIIEWVTYHERMLHLFEENLENLLLLEGECVIQNLNRLDRKTIGAEITSKLILTSGTSWNTPTFIDSNGQLESSLVDNNSKETLIINLLKKYPKIINIFNTFIDKANLKCSEPLDTSVKEEVNDLLTKYFRKDIKRDLQNENQLLTTQLHSLQEDIEQKYIKENQILESQLLLLQEKTAALYLENNEEKRVNATVSDQDDSELIRENQELIKQLQILQERSELLCESESVKAENDIVISENLRLVEQLHSLQIKLEDSCGDLGVTEQTKILKENQLLMTQLHNVQDELEELYSRVEAN